MKIFLRPRDISIAIIVFIGTIILLIGMWDYYNVKTAMPLEFLTSENIEKGKYVKGVINEYCGVVVEGINYDYFTGESAHYMSLMGELAFYTVKLKNGQYITLMAKNEATKVTLENFKDGVGGSVYIEGVITSPVTELNYPWLQTALGKESQEEVNELVYSQYAIREHNFSYIGVGMLCGLAFLFTALVMVISDRIEKHVMEKRIAESLEQINYYHRT